MQDDRTSSVNVAFLSLYSSRFPAIGESHGLSVVVGALAAAMPPDLLQMRVLDMIQWGTEDTTRAVDVVREIQANVLAIGLPYGTFSVFRREYPALRAALHGESPLVLLGGALPTYLSGKILHEIAPEAVIIIGEADHSLPLVVKAWMNGEPFSGIPNLHYIDRSTQEEVTTPRRLVDLSTASSPYRKHIESVYKSGGQIYSESSRGCSWSACTFCLRGLTDVTGRSLEYRRKPASLVAADLVTLADIGIRDITFADEDFLGGPLSEAKEFIDQLQINGHQAPKFDVSLTVHSVYSRRDTAPERETRNELLAKLVDMGLQKVFLGVESCSPGQLKRYAKGHTREEAIAAARLLQQLGVRVEIGVILFDPLCTLDEIADSLSFMQDTGLAPLASGISSELRLQCQSRYLALLENYERRHNVVLHSPELDPDTLSHAYVFASKTVEDFFGMVQKWNRRIRPLYYPAKSLSRFGAAGSIGEAAYPLRRATETYRQASCAALLASIAAIKSGGDGEAVLDDHLTSAAAAFARDTLAAISALTPEQACHPVVRQAIAAASDPRLGFTSRLAETPG